MACQCRTTRSSTSSDSPRTPARTGFSWPSKPPMRSSIAPGRACFSRASAPRTSTMLRNRSRLAARGSRKRLRPERAAGGKRREAAPASESAWGWGPARSDKCRWSPLCMVAILCVSVIGVGACRQDMHNQPKYRGLRPSTFFGDGSSARPLVEGTVARGTLHDDEAFFTGKMDKVTVKELPFPVDEAVLNRGQERYNIYCSPCHDKTGSGNGMVIQRGFKRQPPSYHIDR